MLLHDASASSRMSAKVQDVSQSGGCGCIAQVGEQAPAPESEAVRVCEHPGGWYAAGESEMLSSRAKIVF